MAQSLRYGVSKARRVKRSVADELSLAVQEAHENQAELEALWRWEEEDEPLSSPFAVRSTPTMAELCKFF